MGKTQISFATLDNNHYLYTLKGSESENGNEADWWTEPDRMAYEVLQKRLVELYNGITPFRVPV
jgi:predicted metalloendopeptidase